MEQQGHLDSALSERTTSPTSVAPATPLPWKWWTSNSHYRLSSDVTGKDGDVIYAYRASDGMSVVQVRPKDASYIQHACNAYPKLVETLRFIVDYSGGEESERYYSDVARCLALLRELGESVSPQDNASTK